MTRGPMRSLAGIVLGFALAIGCTVGGAGVIEVQAVWGQWFASCVAFVVGGIVAGLIARRSRTLHGLLVGLLPTALLALGTLFGLVQFQSIPLGIVVPSAGGGLVGGSLSAFADRFTRTHPGRWRCLVWVTVALLSTLLLRSVVLRQAQAMYARGLRAQERHEYNEAILDFARSGRMCVFLADREGSIVSQMAVGSVYQHLGIYEVALSWFYSAQGSAGASEKYVRYTADAHRKAGEVLTVLQRYGDAMEHLQQALRLQKKLNNERSVALVLGDIGDLKCRRGEYDAALGYYRKALETRGSDSTPESVVDHSSIATVFCLEGRYSDAIAHMQRALELAEQARDSATASHLWDNLGHIFLAAEDYPRAEEAFTISSEFAKRSGDEPRNLGLIDLTVAKGRYREALTSLQLMEPSRQASPDFRVYYHCLLGEALAGSGAVKEASREFLAAVELVEEERGFVRGDTANFMRDPRRLRTYRGLVAGLAELSLNGETLPAALMAYGPDPASAGFYFAESTKARSLLEKMANARRKTSRVEIAEELRAREEMLLNQLSALEALWQKGLEKGSREAIREAHEREHELKAELDSLIEELRRNYVAYAVLHYPRPLPAASLPLKVNEVLLEYALGNKASYLFVVRGGGVRKIVRIPLGREALERKVTAFMEPLVNAQGAGFSTRLAKELYDLLLVGALVGVRTTDQVLVVPDGILGLLPFDALVIEEGSGLQTSRFVGDQYALRYYQSAAVLALQRQLAGPMSGRTLFALGNPVFANEDPRNGVAKLGTPRPVLLTQDQALAAYRALATRREWGKTTKGDNTGTELVYLPLPETGTEVKAIANILGVPAKAPDVLLDLEATESQLREAPLHDYRYIHFATHADLPGKVQGVNEPFILLGQVGNQGEDDGFLTLSEVLGLKLSAELVVLSACVTGRGQVMEGEGVMNLARAFQQAGARAVVVSLWEVASAPAVEYMTTFYSQLQRGQSRLEALRQARRAIKARYPNPFYWAVFILHGEG